MGFEFATAHRIIFGSGSSQQVGKIAGEYGKNAFVITRKTGDEGIRKILKQLTEAGIDYHTHKIEGEPSIKGIEAGVAEARQSACDLVIAIGGGVCWIAEKRLQPC